jgi:chaperone modulatory protein CbpM
MDITAVTALFPGLTQIELVTWVERGWVLPDDAGSGFVFREIDVARVRLIRDLRQDMKTPSLWCCRCSTRSTNCARH